MSTENENEVLEDLGTVTLMLDEGELECEIMAIFPAGDKQYIALRPMTEEEDEENEELFFYRYIWNGEDEDPDLAPIEDDEEFEICLDAYDELLDDEMFDMEDE